MSVPHKFFKMKSEPNTFRSCNQSPIKQVGLEVSAVDFVAKFIQVVLSVFSVDAMVAAACHSFGVSDHCMHPRKNFSGFFWRHNLLFNFFDYFAKFPAAFPIVASCGCFRFSGFLDYLVDLLEERSSLTNSLTKSILRSFLPFGALTTFSDSTITRTFV